MFFLLTFWVGAMTTGLVFAKPRISGRLLASPLMVTTGFAALLMLSYPTITLRYRIDLWPFVMTLCLLSFPGLMYRFGSDWLNATRVLSVSLVLLASSMMYSPLTVTMYSRAFQTTPNGFFGAWDAEACADMVNEKGLATFDIPRICADPETVFPVNSIGK